MTEKLIEAQKYAMSIRPEVGGFPILAEVLRQAGQSTFIDFLKAAWEAGVIGYDLDFVAR